MTAGYQCDNCQQFTRKPVKIKYPTSDKKIDYLGTKVPEDDMQDSQPEKEHYCQNCIETMKEGLKND